MKRVLIRSALAVAILAAMGAVQAQDIKERILKFGLNGPDGHPAVAGMKKFADLVRQKSRRAPRWWPTSSC